MNARKMYNAIVLPLFIQRYRGNTCIVRVTNLYSRITNFIVKEGGGKIGIFVIFVILSSDATHTYIYIERERE